MNFKLWLEDNPYTKERKTWPSYQSNPELMASLPDDKLWFHGSENEFDQFKIAGIKRRSNHWNNFLGIHFTSDPNIAYNISTYDSRTTDPKKGFVYEVELDVTNPLDIGREFNMDVEALKLAYEEGIVTDSDISKTIRKPNYISDGGSWSDKEWKPKDLIEKVGVLRSRHILNNLGNKRAPVARFYKKYLQNLGYDSIIYQSDYRGEGHAPCIVVFDENKVRIHQKKDS